MTRMVSCLLLMALMGCASAPQSTRFTAEDFTDMSEAMAQSLMKSPTIASRGPTSPLWVVAIDKVQNLTSDVMTDAEQWAIISRVRGSLALGPLWDRNIRFVIPVERQQQLDRDFNLREEQAAGFGAGRQPTHTMTATFRSMTRGIAIQRTELYYCQFELFDIRTGQPVWSDAFEFKRAATGHVWD